MWTFLVLGAILGAASAVPPIWYTDGACGQTKYNVSMLHNGPSTNIEGGAQAAQGEFPFVTQIRRISDGEVLCSASIVNQNYVLTSAYCLRRNNIADSNDKTIEIVAGDHDKSIAEPNEMVYNVSWIVMYESFQFEFEILCDNDTAVIQLTSPIAFNDDVQPVCAPDPDYDYRTEYSLTVMGWGDQDRFGGGGSNVLMSVDVRGFSNSYCTNEYRLFGYTINDRMICASDDANHETANFCTGDYGSPLVHYDDVAEVYRQVGIASYERGCANGEPGVYTYAANPQIQNWIDSKIFVLSD